MDPPPSFLGRGRHQLTHHPNLVLRIRTQRGRAVHATGFRGKVARSTLADANESRDWRIFADFAQVLNASLGRCTCTTKLVSIAIRVCTLWIRRPSICVCRSSRGRSFVSARPPSRCILCWTCTTFPRSFPQERRYAIGVIFALRTVTSVTQIAAENETFALVGSRDRLDTSRLLNRGWVPRIIPSSYGMGC